MKTSSLIILTFFTLGCSRKNVVHLSDQHIVNVNKNYIFCNCVFQANKRLAIEQKNSSNQIIKDGSSEVYFIDNEFSVEPDADPGTPNGNSIGQIFGEDGSSPDRAP